MDIKDIKWRIEVQYLNYGSKISNQELIKWAKKVKSLVNQGFSLREAVEQVAESLQNYLPGKINKSSSLEFQISMIDYIIQNELKLLAE